MNTQSNVARIGELLDALYCGAMLMARDGFILHANRRLCEMSGLTCEQLRGRTLHDLYAATARDADIDEILSHFDEPVEREFFIPRPDGTRVPVITSGRPLDGEGGPACYRVVTIIDISQRKAAEERREALHVEVARLSDTVMEQALDLRGYSQELEKRVEQRTQELHEANMESIYMLAIASEAKDADTGAHVRRIESYARRLAAALGKSKREAETIGYSAILHDVGKMHVPDAILKKPGPLTPDEQALMRQHTINGERMLSRKPFFDLARRIARSHHENWDGSGYPDGLSGEAIPLEARIVHLVDVYDALASERPYKSSWAPEKALEAVRVGAGALFEPRLVATFLHLAESGEIRTGPDPL